ncbi:MAG: hypothetical protein M1480_03140 [Bacteroidetes bacterium]|nr:hypothetical protein [Bacteroidota bacterium]MCL5027995.1 hypothetical protein [Bacteroidota bacterium]
MQAKELLKKLGEETLYSTKGHFKACDLRRIMISCTIWICAVLNVISLIGINSTIDKWIAASSLFGLIALLIWNEGEEKNYRAKHKQAAETYLSLHKKIRSYFLLEKFDNQEIEKLSNEVIQFDKSEKPEIPAFARLLAKRAIEKKGETDNWF